MSSSVDNGFIVMSYLWQDRQRQKLYSLRVGNNRRYEGVRGCLALMGHSCVHFSVDLTFRVGEGDFITDTQTHTKHNSLTHCIPSHRICTVHVN